MHRHAELQILVERCVVVCSSRPSKCEGSDLLPIDKDQELVRTVLAEPADASGQIAHEPDLNVVLAVLRKRIWYRHSTARADRQPGHLFFLREVGGQPKDVVLNRGLCSADREAADFLGCRDVASERSEEHTSEL